MILPLNFDATRFCSFKELYEKYCMKSISGHVLLLFFSSLLTEYLLLILVRLLDIKRVDWRKKKYCIGLSVCVNVCVCVCVCEHRSAFFSGKNY